MNKEALHKLAVESLTDGLRLDDWDKIGCVNHDCDQCKALAEQPAQQDIPDLIAGALGVSRGTAYDMMREALAEQQEPVAWADECRIELVNAIHFLASDFENALGAFGGDIEARRKAEGDIAHARSVASRWNWNGTSPQAQPAREPLTDALWGLLDAIENELNRRAIPEVWLLMAHKAGRAYIEAAHGITKGNT